MPDRPQADPTDQHTPEETARRLDRALKRSVTMPPPEGNKTTENVGSGTPPSQKRAKNP